MMFTNKQPCYGTFTVTNHTTCIFEDAVEVIYTSVTITDVGEKQFTTKSKIMAYQIQNLPLLC